MPDGQFIIITKDLLPELARELAPLLLQQLGKGEQDSYLTPAQLAERVPVLKEHAIRKQIRSGYYGKKYGAKGRLMAKVSEVKKYNRI